MKPLFTLILFTSSLFVLAACNEKQAETTNTETSSAVVEKEAASEAAKVTEEKPAPVESTATETPAEGTEASQLAYGHELHEDNCARCHEPEFYTREDRKVQDRAKLDTMIRACDAQLGTSLFDEDMEILANYLDKTYYKFSK